MLCNLLRHRYGSSIQCRIRVESGVLLNSHFIKSINSKQNAFTSVISIDAQSKPRSKQDSNHQLHLTSRNAKFTKAASPVWGDKLQSSRVVTYNQAFSIISHDQDHERKAYSSFHCFPQPGAMEDWRTVFEEGIYCNNSK